MPAAGQLVKLEEPMLILNTSLCTAASAACLVRTAGDKVRRWPQSKSIRRDAAVTPGGTVIAVYDKQTLQSITGNTAHNIQQAHIN